MNKDGWTKYQIIYEACKQATKKNMKALSTCLDTKVMLMYPKDYCCFRAIDVEQNSIKSFNAYMRRHHVKMGLVPVHSPGGYARYMFVMPSFREALMNDALNSLEG